MKKALFTVIFSIITLFFGTCAHADAIYPIQNGTALYFSPQTQTWSANSTQDSIKIVKKSNAFIHDNKTAFTINADYCFITKNTLSAVNNNTLKFYTVKYDENVFKTKEMTPEEVQALFDNVTVIPVSKFNTGAVTIKRTPFTIETFMLVNDTNLDFTGYKFSPPSIQKTPIKGVFIARKVGQVKFVKNGDFDRRELFLTIKIRNDADKYTTGYQQIYYRQPAVVRH